MRERQNAYEDSSDDPLREALAAFLDRKVPVDWESWTLSRRRAYRTNPDPLDPEGVVRIDRVTSAEFICEQLRRDIADKDYKYLSRRVCGLLRELGWTKIIYSRHAASLYGRQRAFLRPEAGEEEDEL